jgi:hypothetical protein
VLFSLPLRQLWYECYVCEDSLRLKGNQVQILSSPRCCKLHEDVFAHKPLSQDDGKAAKAEASQKTCQARFNSFGLSEEKQGWSAYWA